MNNKNISIINIPFDGNSSYKKGSALASELIKEALYCDSANMWTESGTNLNEINNWSFEFSDTNNSFSNIEKNIDRMVGEKCKIL